MTASAMRAQLIAYLKSVDDQKITGLYTLLKENIPENIVSPLTNEQLSFLNEEREKHLKGESKSYNWEEVKEMIRNKKAS